MTGEYQEAILNYEKALELAPTSTLASAGIGRCYRNLQDLAKAEEYLKKTLKLLPFDPRAHYEIALVYADMGSGEKALEHLQIALDVWKEADHEFEPAQKARQKLAELTALS